MSDWISCHCICVYGYVPVSPLPFPCLLQLRLFEFCSVYQFLISQNILIISPMGHKFSELWALLFQSHKFFLKFIKDHIKQNIFELYCLWRFYSLQFIVTFSTITVGSLLWNNFFYFCCLYSSIFLYSVAYVCINYWCAFLKMLFELQMWKKKALVPDWVMKMHSPIKQKHTPWCILSNVMNYPTTAGTEGFSCVIISCSVLVTQAAIMYHVEFEYEFQPHDYLLLLLPLTFFSTPIVIYCLS